MVLILLFAMAAVAVASEPEIFLALAAASAAAAGPSDPDTFLTLAAAAPREAATGRLGLNFGLSLILYNGDGLTCTPLDCPP